MSPVIALEHYTDVIGEMKLLLEQHWEELASYADIPLDPDYGVYEKLAEMDLVRIYTVRLDGLLTGYAVYLVRAHPHYRQHVWANADIFWLHPAMRGASIGKALFEFVEADLRAAGVAVMHTTFKTGHPHPAPILETLGHAHVEMGYSKRLAD